MECSLSPVMRGECISLFTEGKWLQEMTSDINGTGKNSLSVKMTAFRLSFVFIDHYGLQMTYNKLSRHLCDGDESLGNTD